MLKKGWRENLSLNGRFVPLFQLRKAPEFHPGIWIKAAKQRERRWSSQTGEKKGILRDVLSLSTKQGRYGELKEFFPIFGGSGS